jgi:SiaC family regulatory phosphoprotein
MKDLVIERTYSTPSVSFIAKTGLLRIEGRSIPENPAVFYDPIMNWLQDYFPKTNVSTKIDVKLDYINSGSSKSILAMFKMIKQFYDNGFQCQVNWHFEEDDESIRDLGKHFKTLLKMPFNLVETYS